VGRAAIKLSFKVTDTTVTTRTVSDRSSRVTCSAIAATFVGSQTASHCAGYDAMTLTFRTRPGNEDAVQRATCAAIDTAEKARNHCR
jgi:hypothetical protein